MSLEDYYRLILNDGSQHSNIDDQQWPVTVEAFNGQKRPFKEGLNLVLILKSENFHKSPYYLIDVIIN